MSNARWLSLVAACGAFLWLYHTLSPGDSNHPPTPIGGVAHASPRRFLPERTTPSLLGVDQDDVPEVVSRHSLTVQLHRDPRQAVPSTGALVARWDPSRAWPLPDELPDDPVTWALQDVWLSQTDPDRPPDPQQLDALDAALAEWPDSTDPWATLARIEARHLLYKADYEAALLDHNQALERWVDRGGEGPPPEAPEPWQAAELAHEADVLAATANVLGEDPWLASLAQLTAASLRMSWTAADTDEDAAVDDVFDVLHRSDDPLVLAAAVDLALGTRAAQDDVAVLEAVSDELPHDVAARLAWLQADAALATGDTAGAQARVEAGLFHVDAAGLGAEPVATALSQSLPPLVGLNHGSLADSLDAALTSLVWQCWDGLLAQDDPWVDNGTDYDVQLVALPGALTWTDATDDNPHLDCLIRETDALPRPDEPLAVELMVSTEAP